MKTFSPNAAKAQESREWLVVDAAGQTLGRLATQISAILRGKHKPTYSPHMDCGDFVIVINCEQIEVTGNKLDDVKYYTHSRYPGGLKNPARRPRLALFPDRIITAAVHGMMPKTRLGRAQMKKFKVYAGGEHPHQAQQPKVLDL